MVENRRRKVVILYRYIPQYRRDFYNLLRAKLAAEGVELRLLYGQPGRRDALKRDAIDLEWAEKVPSRIWEIGSRELYWQPVLGRLKDAALVIVEQASKLLVNYPLQAMSAAGRIKLAFWGHGKNFQGNDRSAAERIKRMLSPRVHWWFAYNELSARVVESMGYPRERITTVQNAIDTRSLASLQEALPASEIRSAREALGIRGRNVGLFVGGMYPEKRLSFLIRALRRVRERVPDFEMIFLGSGEDLPIIQEAAAESPWIHSLGPKFDREKVLFYGMAKLVLMPGLVGLTVLDSFALGVPLVTVDLPIHSPEIAYLQSGVNGWMLPAGADPDAYADEAARLLCDEAARARLVTGCREAARQYTVENMAERFCAGILRALAI